MWLLHVMETSPNLEAMCALSDNPYLAYPRPCTLTYTTFPLTNAGGATSWSTSACASAPSTSTSQALQSGDILLFSARSPTVSNVFRAHKSPLASLALNSTGTLLATSSERDGDSGGVRARGRKAVSVPSG